MLQSLQKTVRQFPINLNMRISYYPAILLLHIYPREMKHMSEDLYIVYGSFINKQQNYEQQNNSKYISINIWI